MKKPDKTNIKQTKSKWQIANKILNIVIVIMGCLWLAVWYFAPQAGEFEKQAKIEFEKANAMFEKALLTKSY